MKSEIYLLVVHVRIEKRITLSILFTLDDKNDKLSEKVLAGLETIDDETDSSDMLFVKVSEIEEAKAEFGESVIGDELPSLVLFDEKIPSRFEGMLMYS